MYINVFNDSRFLLCDKTHRKKIEKVIHFSGEERRGGKVVSGILT
jgi:hypothetical protein